MTNDLKELLPPGSTVYTVRLAYNNRNGSSVHAILIVDNGKIRNISNLVAYEIGRSWDTRNGIPIGESAFTIVQELSYSLHGYQGVGNKQVAVPNPTNYKGGYSLIHQSL